MLKIALCQTKVFSGKDVSLRNAVERITEASQNGAEIISLPEMFNCPYSNDKFALYGEYEKESRTLQILKETCKKEKVYLVAGSIPELEDDKIYNTSYVIDPGGRIIGKHRKLHLFDVDIENGVKFFESDTITKGNEIVVIDTVYCRIGLCICYDIRFPELIRNLVLRGAKLIFVPAAFNMTTGPAHWELLFRARALDNQIYIAGISPARDCDGSYKPYGNSLVVDPWGRITARAGIEDEIIYSMIDLQYEEKVRNELPLLKHRRPELYL